MGVGGSVPRAAIAAVASIRVSPSGAPAGRMLSGGLMRTTPGTRATQCAAVVHRYGAANIGHGVSGRKGR